MAIFSTANRNGRMADALSIRILLGALVHAAICLGFEYWFLFISLSIRMVLVLGAKEKGGSVSLMP